MKHFEKRVTNGYKVTNLVLKVLKVIYMFPHSESESGSVYM
jgi:hypothetical protein